MTMSTEGEEGDEEDGDEDGEEMTDTMTVEQGTEDKPTRV